MTKERALEILQERLDLAERNGTGVGDYYDVLRVAIDAIKQQKPNGRMLYQSGYQQGLKDGWPKWVPVSERLPEEETDVIVTRTFLGIKDGNDHIPPKTYVEVAQHFNGEWSALSDEYKAERNRHTDPVAWMSLPEPWEGEEE